MKYFLKTFLRNWQRAWQNLFSHQRGEKLGADSKDCICGLICTLAVTPSRYPGTASIGTNLLIHHSCFPCLSSCPFCKTLFRLPAVLL